MERNANINRLFVEKMEKKNWSGILCFSIAGLFYTFVVQVV